ncbi:MAG: type IV pilus assembly protein PilM [Thiotrichaceae bacterium]|nr:type IV pilus assembly protein PilM [Thiotrichaceae bacterium]
MSIFSLKPDPVVGIDISSTAVKLLELSRSNKGIKVESYGMEYLPEKAIQDKNIVDIEVVGNVINRLVTRAKPRSQYAAVAVAGPTVITKTITMDAGLSENDIKEQIEMSPAQYLGQSENSEEIEFDYQVIGPNDKDESRVDVLLVASHSETLNAYITALEMANLKVKVVDIEKYALENAFITLAQSMPEIDEGDTVALIEVGATITSLRVLGEQKGEPKVIYTGEDLMFGGNQLTEQIQARYDLSYEETNLAKRNNDLPDDYFKTILEPFKIDVAAQIKLMVEHYYKHSDYGKLSHILMAGGCASIPKLVDHVKDKVDGHVMTINPFSAMSIATRVSNHALMNDAPALMIAYGLAHRTFDKY